MGALNDKNLKLKVEYVDLHGIGLNFALNSEDAFSVDFRKYTKKDNGLYYDLRIATDKDYDSIFLGLGYIKKVLPYTYFTGELNYDCNDKKPLYSLGLDISFGIFSNEKRRINSFKTTDKENIRKRYPDINDKTLNAIKENRILTGMSSHQVMDSIGKPDYVFKDKVTIGEIFLNLIVESIVESIFSSELKEMKTDNNYHFWIYEYENEVLILLFKEKTLTYFEYTNKENRDELITDIRHNDVYHYNYNLEFEDEQ